MALLEVIALDARDAVAAEAGGADRLEVVADMASDGLTPSVEVVGEIKSSVRLPLRVMLRPGSTFAISALEMHELHEAAVSLAEAGADGFVFGFLGADGKVDLTATRTLAAAIAPLPWTFHRAVDHAADPCAAYSAVYGLRGLDAVLTAGSPLGVSAGLPVLISRDPSCLLVGGGLRREHVPSLIAHGVSGFHVGSAVRASWNDPVDAVLVAEWKALLTSR